MAGNEKPLLLGGGQIRVAGRFAGEVTNCYVEKTTNKVQHQTNFGLEYRTDHVLAITTGYNLGFTMQRINPENANLLVGAPGFSAIGPDRSLPGDRRDISLIGYGLNRLLYNEQPKLTYDENSKGVWSPLLYPIAAPLSTGIGAPIITMSNQDFLGTALAYYCYVVTIQRAGGATTVSLPSNMEFVPSNATPPGHEALLLTLRAPSGTTYLITDEISVYRIACTRDAITGEFSFTGAFTTLHGSGVGTDTGWETVAIGVATAPNFWRINGDNTAGGDFFGVDMYMDTTVVGGIALAVTAITVSTYDADHTPSVPALTVKTWPTDFVFEQNRFGGGAIKLTKGSTIPHASIVSVDYYYDTTLVRELPLIGLGRNPVVPVTLEILFPDNYSKMIWHFYKAQINTNFRLATNETDWMGVDFTGETIDASDIYPRFGFGYLQFSGPIISLINQFGNMPFGTHNELSANQTTYA